MMSTIAEQLQEAADKATQASELAGLWANGPDNTTVPTDSGPVPTIAEFNRAAQARVDASIEAIGWVLAGDFTAGCTVTDRNQYVLVVGGAGYRWDGVLPKVVSPGSSPTPIATGSWVLVGDMSLRGDLAAAGGAELVGIGVGRTQADKNTEWVSVTDAPYSVRFDNGATDHTAALNAAFQSGKNIWIPDPGEGNFAEVTGTVYYDSKTVIRGPGKYKPVIKAASSMPGEQDLLAPINETFGTLSYLRNVIMFDLCVDANGFNRAKTVGYVGEWGRGIRIGAMFDSLFIRCHAIGGPQHGIDVACWKDGYIDIGHAGVAVGRPFNVILSECDTTDWVYDDGLTTHGCYNVLIEKHTSRITDAAKAVHTYTPTQKGIEIDDGSVGIVIAEPRMYGNGTQTMAFSVSTHANEPAAYDIQWDNPWAEGCQIAFGAWADTATDVAFDSAGWRCRNVRVRNLVFVKPTYDDVGTIFLSRFLDFQGFVDSGADGVEVRISAEDGTYSAPVSQVNLFNAKRIDINNVKVLGVPGVPSGTYTQPRDNGWVRIGVGCADVRIDGFHVDNVGYLNRVVNDNFSSSLTSAKRVKCDTIPSDSQTKIGIISSATNVEYQDVSVPAGMEPYRIGRLATSYPTGNYRLNQTGDGDTVIGGLEIRSEALASGGQARPGILFNRQFVSASDPTGTLGKGAIAFRTTAASEGRLSISAFHEDVNEFRPILSVRSTNSIKSLIPVQDNAVSLGEAPNNRYTQVVAVTNTIVTSDEREKTPPSNITDSMLNAADDISIDVWQWLDAIAKKGEDSARWHFGPIAQQVRDAFAKHGLDGCDYGLLCYDKWGDEFVDIMEELAGEDGGTYERPTGERHQIQWAGDRWGIRPDQCLWLLAAASRRRVQQAESRLDDIEQRLSELEAK